MITPPEQRIGNLSHRQNLLIEANVLSLRRALNLLENIDDATYTDSPRGFAPHRVGGHLRHILEFYQCFLDGIKSSHVDYDARKRDESVETNRQSAIVKIHTIIQELQNSPALYDDSIIRIRMEDVPENRVREPYLISSPGRELQVLSSHTIHHFALIAVTLMAHGIAVDPDFGMAPSTLRYLASGRQRQSMGEGA